MRYLIILLLIGGCNVFGADDSINFDECEETISGPFNYSEQIEENLYKYYFNKRGNEPGYTYSVAYTQDELIEFTEGEKYRLCLERKEKESGMDRFLIVEYENI